MFNLNIECAWQLDIRDFYPHIPHLSACSRQHNTMALEFKFVREKNFNVYSGPSDYRIGVDEKSQIIEDIPHFIYYVLRKKWLQNYLYPVHCLSYRQSLIIGSSGSGKTQLALELERLGQRVNGYNRSVVQVQNSYLQTLAATNYISVRHNAQCALSPALDCQDYELLQIKNGRALYLNRNYEYTYRVIDSIYFLLTDNLAFRCEELGSGAALHSAVNYFLDTDKSIITLDSGQWSESAMPGRVETNSLVQPLAQVLKNIKARKLMGKTRDIALYLKENL